MSGCLQCGAPLAVGAKFCAACGNPVDAAGAGELKRTDNGRPRRVSATASWIAAVIGAFLLGGGLTALFMAGSRPGGRQVAMRAPSPARAPSIAPSGMPPGHPSRALPEGHPLVRGPAGVGGLLAKAEKQAQAHRKDIAVWNRFGDVAFRSAAFNPADYDKAREAFAHVLQLDPDNLEALRGIGDVYFDRHQCNRAIDAYRRYLEHKPNDARVLTDLGTSYLYQHNPHQALKEYGKALAVTPDFFPAEFNTAVAYLLLNDSAGANAALEKARPLAPDSAARMKIDQMMAKLASRSTNADTEPQP